MKKYILLTMLLSFGPLVQAQDDGEVDEGYGPKKGDITVEMQFGRSNIINEGLTVPSAPGNNSSWAVAANSPYANNISLQNNQNTFVNMIGIKGGYYLSDKVSVILAGAVRMDYTPGQANVPGFINSGPNAAWIPAYAAIPEQNSTLLNAVIGSEYTFKTKMERVFPYVGLHVPFYYAQQSEYDPTITDAAIGGEGSGNIANTVVDLGTRTGEIFGFGVQFAAGVDYYLMEGFYFGFEIRPASYIYAYSASKPGPGLELQQSNTNTYSFFTQPFMKLGFKF
ncbi:MAG: BT1926 family outer membrane beta-barrel protein [Cyclobacteriaceae bacterium]